MKEPKVTFVIGAQPGWFVVDTCIGEDLKPIAEISKIPVVAWKIMDNDWAEPLLADGMPNRRYYLLSPDGQVCEPSSRSWDTVEDFIKAMMNPKTNDD